MRSRAAIMREVGGAWSVEEYDLDPPRTGEVLVQMAAAGLCHSDDHIRNGFMSPPGASSPCKAGAGRPGRAASRIAHRCRWPVISASSWRAAMPRSSA